MIIRFYIEYWLLLATVFVIRTVPFKAAVWIAQALADFAFDVLKIRIKVTTENLKTAFGNKMTDEQIKVLAKKVYRNFMVTSMEFIRIPNMTYDEVRAMTTIVGVEHLEKGLKRGKGIILVACHYGNWEMMGTAIRANGYPITYIDGEQKNIFVEKFITNNRIKSGIKLIARKNALRGVIKTVKNNEILALLSDQNAGPEGVFVDFFGKPASTPQGAAAFVLKTGASMVLAYNVPSDDRKHNTVYLETIEINPTGNQEKDIFTITETFSKKFEKFIAEKPEHYFWLHRKWKSRPPQES
ncbi:MAG: hypothetical protein A2252_07870 [Elusimicrobia bacterium RIFOXYA2_FULL_39_19]|nr:MAG: hypothetical protein A2252_07870 [Elusimicrobia bacterium RIFOXYA2_FULL_39_19]